MGENLVIVESPAKAKTIEKFLGKNFTVKSSFGHIRDLSKKNLGIDIKNDFTPEYIVSEDKAKLVSALKDAADKAVTVWLASDEDREGEAIAWHLAEALDLDLQKTKRIVFHEITKNAILNAIENPRNIDINLVHAQQARRVLDRLVGFELSPILWKKVKPQLSAGRVQSAALRLIVDREREILGFKSHPYFKTDATFHPEGTPAAVKIKSTLDKKFSSEQDAQQFLQDCAGAQFHISSIEKKDVARTPAPPFTTSTLQQEASRKFGFSVSQTMSIAQRLYESGLITYMRTDSTNLSELALATAKKSIEALYGSDYSKTRRYKTKAKGAQEAHEAIRPTYLDRTTIEGTAQEKKLYDLIWKRTIASQMTDAKLEKTDITITSDRRSEEFTAVGSQVLFDGFLKVYMESHDDENTKDEEGLLPHMEVGQRMMATEIISTQKHTSKPLRYTEASLVKKMEELGIGRPSTYAPTITTLTQRGYVIKDDRIGEEKEIIVLKLKKGDITKETKKEVIGTEKKKLCPEEIGLLVTDFLEEHFPEILDYGFTAKVEENFDKIAAGKLSWNKPIKEFYTPFHDGVEKTLHDAQPKNAERLIGTDPATGKNVLARVGRFGPLVQIGNSDDPDKKFASLPKGKLIESLTLQEALSLFKLPRTLGEYDGKTVSCSSGRFGPYVKHGSSFISMGKGGDPYTIDLEEAIKLIQEHQNKQTKQNIKEFPEHDICILNGRFGPYIKHAGNNYKIPKNIKAEEITLEECQNIITNYKKK
jgi:DNA topoisomerase-1